MEPVGAREEIRQLVEIATLGTGILEEAEEHRLVKIALGRGLGPVEAREAIEAALSVCSAKRAEKPVRAPDPPPPPPPPPPAPEPPRKPPVPIEDPVARVIARRMLKKNRASSAVLPATSPLQGHAETKDQSPVGKPGGSEPVLVPELVSAGSAPEPVIVPQEVAPPAPEFVCTACLARVTEDELERAVAERLADGRVHCRRCTSKLSAGLMCAVCYRPVTRTQIESGTSLARGDRAFHADCLPRDAAPAPPAPPTRVATPASGSPILGPSQPALSASSGVRAALGQGTAKCAGCYVTIPAAAFKEGRAVASDGQTWCETCARRAGRLPT